MAFECTCGYDPDKGVEYPTLSGHKKTCPQHKKTMSGVARAMSEVVGLWTPAPQKQGRTKKKGAQ